jgi:hypothetical protein
MAGSAVRAVGVGAVLVAVVAVGASHLHQPAGTGVHAPVITVKCAHGQPVSVQPDTAAARADAVQLCKVTP